MTTAAVAPTLAEAFLPRELLETLLDALRSEGRTVIGPIVRDGAVVYDEIHDASDLPFGWRSETAPGSYRLEESGSARAFDYGLGVSTWKRSSHPPRIPLTTTDPDGLVVAVEPDVPRVAYLGVRGCELAALGIQDRVLRAGPAGDRDYDARRDAAVVVAVECAVAMSTCFCTSTGTGPEIAGGADIVLAELDDGFTVRALTPAGELIVSRLGCAEPTRAQIDAAADQIAAVRSWIGYPVPMEGLPERLRAVPEHPRWEQIAERCLACTNCTLVCPTCFCTSVVVSSDLDGTTGATERVWDSCFTLGFGRVAGDSNFRPRVADRYRQWLTHKFSSWWDQFGSSGCVGCGRCITWCPVGIDVREELLAIAPPGAAPAPIPWPPAPPLGHAPTPLAIVEPARYVGVEVSGTRRETADTVTLALETDDPALLASRPGQFVMVARPAQAVPPISISRIRPAGLDLTIRDVGPATAALAKSQPGDRLSLRGPLGRPWPIDAAFGGDIAIVAGGIGLAPLRPVIDEVLRERHRFGAVRIYVGARTPRDRLFVAEMTALRGRIDVEVEEIVDRGGPEWLGRVGVVTQLFEHAAWSGEDTTAFVCGPDRMMQAAARTLASHGVPPERTWVTLERNMACGVGLCGHCQLGPYFVCRDGPVFSVAELGDTFTVDGR